MAKSTTPAGSLALPGEAFTRAFPNSHRLAAARVVLPGLCGQPAVTFPPRLDTVRALVRRWRQRVDALAAAGEPRLTTPLARAWAMHCPPLAFATDTSGRRPCNLAGRCPLCHGVQVGLLYENVTRALNRAARDGRQLRLYVRRWRRDVALDDLDASLADLAAAADTILKPRPPAGTVVRATVVPHPKRDDHVVIRRRVLVAYDDGARVPDEFAADGYDAQRTNRPAAVRVARAVAATWPYPPELLTAPAERVVAVAAVLKGRRLNSTAGVFRSAGSARSLCQADLTGKVPAERPRGDLGLDGKPDPVIQVLAEEAALVSGLPAGAFDHEAYALKGLRRRLGRPGRGGRFATAAGLPGPLVWLGRLPLTQVNCFRPGRAIHRRVRDALKGRDPAGTVLVIFSPDGGYWALRPARTAAKDAGGWDDDTLPNQVYARVLYNGIAYWLEPLGRYAAWVLKQAEATGGTGSGRRGESSDEASGSP